MLHSNQQSLLWCTWIFRQLFHLYCDDNGVCHDPQGRTATDRVTRVEQVSLTPEFRWICEVLPSLSWDNGTTAKNASNLGPKMLGLKGFQHFSTEKRSFDSLYNTRCCVVFFLEVLQYFQKQGRSAIDTQKCCTYIIIYHICNCRQHTYAQPLHYDGVCGNCQVALKDMFLDMLQQAKLPFRSATNSKSKLARHVWTHSLLSIFNYVYSLTLQIVELVHSAL